jgi:hypothetical protein
MLGVYSTVASPNIEALLDANPDDGPALELIHFAVHSPRSPYGVPRWVGTLLAVLGSRQMEEVNCAPGEAWGGETMR